MAVLPTGNVITVTSTATLSGNKSFQLVMKFVDRSSSPSSQSLTGTLADIGNLKIDFDTQEDAKELNDFVYNCAEFNFSIKTGSVKKYINDRNLIECWAYDTDYSRTQKILEGTGQFC